MTSDLVTSDPVTSDPVSSDPARADLDVNAVVSYNLKYIRCRRGWTQRSVAERLGRLTGHQLPQASISAMERSFDGPRRRRFDAHELYLLALTFDVPMAYFFLPPPDAGSATLADTHRPVVDLCRALLGEERQLDALAKRAAKTETAANCYEAFLAWRTQRLVRMQPGPGDHLHEVAGVLADLAREIKGRRAKPGPPRKPELPTRKEKTQHA